MVEEFMSMGTTLTIIIIFLIITIPLILQYLVLKLAIKNALKEAAKETQKEDQKYYMTKSAIRDGIVEAQEIIHRKESQQKTETVNNNS